MLTLKATLQYIERTTEKWQEFSGLQYFWKWIENNTVTYTQWTRKKLEVVRTN